MGWQWASGLVRGREPNRVVGAKPLAICHWQPICGVTSLEALAYQSRNTSVQLCPLVDAGKENVYAAFYRSREKGLVRKGDFYVGDIKGLAAAVIRNQRCFWASGLNSQPPAWSWNHLSTRSGFSGQFRQPSRLAETGASFAWIALPPFSERQH